MSESALTAKKPRLDASHLGFVHGILDIIANNAEAAGHPMSKQIADKIKSEERNNLSRVANSRYAAGANDGTYLSQSVMPLQTSEPAPNCDDMYDIGPSDSLFAIQEAGKRGALEAIGEEVESKVKEVVAHLKNELKLCAYLISIPEVLEFLKAVLVSRPKSMELLNTFENGTIGAETGYNSLVNFELTDEVIEMICDLLTTMSLIMKRPLDHMTRQIEVCVSNPMEELNQVIPNLRLAINLTKAAYVNDTKVIEENAPAAAPAPAAAAVANAVGINGIDVHIHGSGAEHHNANTADIWDVKRWFSRVTSMPSPQVPQSDAAAGQQPELWRYATIRSETVTVSTSFEDIKAEGLGNEQIQAIVAAASRVREDGGLSLVGATRDESHIKRSAAVSPFWTLPKSRLFLRYGNESDSWRTILWPNVENENSPVFKEIEATRAIFGKQRTNEFDSKFVDLTYCVSRGLCASRPPHHKPRVTDDQTKLKYNLPFLKFPNIRKSKLQTAAVTIDEIERERLLMPAGGVVLPKGDLVAPSEEFQKYKEGERRADSLGIWFQESPALARWIPFVKSESEYREPSFQVDNTEENLSVASSVVYETAIDLFRHRMETEFKDDSKGEMLMRGAIAAAKISQLDHLSMVFNTMKLEKLTPPHISLDPTTHFFVTRPVVTCVDFKRNTDFVLYPCDVGMAHFYKIGTGAIEDEDFVKYTDTLRVNPANFTDEMNLTPYLRKLLLTDATQTIPIYIANPPELDLLSNADESILKSEFKEFTKDMVKNPSSPNVLPPRLDEKMIELSKRSIRIGIKLCRDLHTLVTERKRVKRLLETKSSQPDQRSDYVSRTRRKMVWNDAMREACISGDKLFAFIRQLSGVINETVDAVCVIDENLMIQYQNKLRDRQARISERAAQEHMQLVKSVFGNVLKDSGLVLGIESGKQIGDLSKLKVVSNTLRKQVSELAQGHGNEGFFGNSVRMEQLLSNGTGELTLEELVARLQEVGKALQASAALPTSEDQPYNGASMDFLSAPRNSMMLRYKPEALAAIRQAFEIFQREFAIRFGVMHVPISAYELMEGNDDSLSMHFATFCAHMLVHSRMFGSSTAMYVGQWPSAANAQQLKISLERLCKAAYAYRMTCSRPEFLTVGGRDAYFKRAASMQTKLFFTPW